MQFRRLRRSTSEKRHQPVRWAAVVGFFAFLIVPSSAARAQLGFTEFALTDSTLNSSPSTDFWIASAAPADVDGDGDLDLLIAGYYVVYHEYAEDRLTLYLNEGPVGDAWALTPVPVDAEGLSFTRGDLAWADYDNDGDQDVVVGAWGATVLYRNDGGSLVRTPTGLPAYREDSDFSTLDLRSIAWADYDNDGDLDLLLPAIVEGFSYVPTRLLRNDGPGEGDAWIFTDVSASLPVAPNAVSVWADMERDGDLDLLLGNISPYGDNFLQTYRNDAGVLTLADDDLARIRYGMADWGDIDNDGDFDVVYCGNIDLPNGTGETVVRVLRNDGPGVYTPIDVVTQFQSPDEPWLSFTAVTWADYDSDGDVDLLVSGEWLGDGEIFGRSLVYANTGGAFAPASEPLPAPIAGNAGGAFTWFDVDGDGDLDYFVAGGYYMEGGGGLIEARTQLFRNDAILDNEAPGRPEGLESDLAGETVILRWDPATDDRTPVEALTYELQVTPGGGSLPSERARPEPGNVSANTTWVLRGLTPGEYQWTVRALDSAFNGGPEATGSFVFSNTSTEGVTPRASVLTLTPPHPNPSSSTATFTLSLSQERPVVVSVHDPAGRRVALIADKTLSAGAHAFTLGRSGLSSGTYFVRATDGVETAVRSVTIVR